MVTICNKKDKDCPPYCRHGSLHFSSLSKKCSSKCSYRFEGIKNKIESKMCLTEDEIEESKITAKGW